MRILITGITGTLGTQVSRWLLDNTDHKVIGYSRDELKQSLIPKHENLTLYLGDVRDGERLLEATRGVDLIFHFAALKRIETLQENPEESVKTNINGTLNVLHAQRMNSIKRVVFSSTDKAVYPIATYGKCKAVAEDLVLRNKNNVVVRYGNVLASRGSAIPVFINSLKNNKAVDITHEDMTRFFMRIEDAAQFVIKSAFEKEGGLKINSKMKATSIVNLVNILSEIIGVKKPKMKTIGIRGVEKLHEDLVASHEGNYLTSYNATKYSRSELIEILTPIVNGQS